MGNEKKRKPRKSLKLLYKRRGLSAQAARQANQRDSSVNFEDSIAAPDSSSNPVAPSTSCAVTATTLETQYLEETPALDRTTNPVVPSTSCADTENFGAPSISIIESDDHDALVCEPTDETLSPDSKRMHENAFGRRIINVSQFYRQLQEISSHGSLSCGLEATEIISETRVGLVSNFKVKCKMCNMTFKLQSDNPIAEMDINTSAVAGAVAIGCGHTQLTEISAAIGLVPMSQNIFSSKLDLINEKWKSELTKSMADAAEEERRLAIQDERVDSNGIAIIDVIADGCYSKRSYRKNYSSLSGAAAIIGKRTNKILYLAIKNKYCCICAIAQTKKVDAREHTCYKNYSGPSTGMESEIIVEGFKKSVDMYQLIYGRLISDGDSNTYSKILQSRPYENVTVEKVECRNHLLRNMCNKLSALCTDTKYNVTVRKTITTKRILQIRKVITDAIKKYKNTEDVRSLYEDIMLAPEHAFGRHYKCKQYFCSQQQNNENIDIFHNAIWQRINMIVTQLAAHARSLILDVDSNPVERFHNVVAKFVGGKRINFCKRYQYQMRCNAAALSYNTQKPLGKLHKSIVGSSPRNEIKNIEAKKMKKMRLMKNYQRKKKRLFNKEETSNYGENCTKPDMEDEMMEKSKKIFLKNLEKSAEERQQILEKTILQSGCSEWLELRRNLLTASNFGRVIKRKNDTSCSNIVKDLLYRKSIDHVESIKHGRDSENIAIQQLCSEHNIEIIRCGLFIDPDVPFLGASPDGIISNDTIVEIKCPKSAYGMTIEEAVKAKKITFYKTYVVNIEINKNHIWYYQVQGQLHITRKDKCLFGIWLGKNVPVNVEVIERDDEFWRNKMESKLKAFYMDCLLPELIDPRHPRKMPIRDPHYITMAIQQKQEKATIAKKRKVPEKEQSQLTASKKKKMIPATLSPLDQPSTSK